MVTRRGRNERDSHENKQTLVMKPSLLFGVLGALMGAMIAGASVCMAQPISGVEEIAALAMPDCDGLAVGDIDGDGDLDLLGSASREGRIVWFEQRATPAQWERHAIYTAGYEDPKIEGNALGDFNGDGRLEAVSLDQRAGRVLLHVPEADPTGAWQTAALRSDRETLQDALVADLDGNGMPELIYTWEGSRKGRGGVHRLTLTGRDVLNPDHWDDRTLITHESAWWLAPRLFDLTGSGVQRELIYTARHLLGRNPASRPGLFWLRPSSDGPGQRHVIDDRLPHPLHVDAGQLTADGPPHDLVVSGFEVDRVYWYDADEDWKRHALIPPSFADEPVTRIWNVETIAVPGQRRDAVLAIPEANGTSAMVLFQWHGDRYAGTVLKQLPYGHAMEDRIVVRDLTGDAMPELIIADSGGEALRVFRFRTSNE